MRIGSPLVIATLMLAFGGGGGTAAGAGWRRILDGGWGTSALVDPGGDVFVGGRTQLAAFEHAFIVLRLDGASGAELWRHEVDGTDIPDCCSDGTDDTALALARLPGGDVVAAGFLDEAATDDDFTVMRLAAATGAEVWRQELHVGIDAAHAVVADPMGDVYAVGTMVVKFDGATGGQLWSYGGLSGANAVALDAAGDVVVAGRRSGSLFTVAKLAAASGAELWSYELVGAPSGNALAVVVDGAGDVLAGGFAGGFTVVKIAGGTGAELWRLELGGQQPARSIAIDPMNDVVVGGDLGGIPSDSLIVKLAGGTGSELWRHSVRGGPLHSSIKGVAIDAAGSVLAGGQAAGRQMALKIDADDGTELWRQVVVGWDYGFAAAPNGDIVRTGIMPDDPDLLYAFRFASLDGSLGSVAGRSLGIIDAGGPRDPRVRLVATDVGVALPPPGSAGDPTIAGATVRLVNPTTLETATIALPSGPSWIVAGDPAAPRAYVYRDRLGLSGPCSHVLVKRARNIGVVCSGNLGPIPFTLDEPSQGSLAVTVQLGSAQPQCAVFGGDVSRDEPGLFRARKSPAILGTCP